MSSVYNMISAIIGSGGGLSTDDAIIAVTVPTGSTLSATKKNISSPTLRPYLWLSADSALYDIAVFSVPAAQIDPSVTANNVWTITAVRGALENASKDITISDNLYYVTELSYWDGSVYDGSLATYDERVLLPITGGWSAYAGTLEEFTESATGLKALRIRGSAGWAQTVNQINAAGFTAVEIDCSTSGTYYSEVGITDTQGSATFTHGSGQFTNVTHAVKRVEIGTGGLCYPLIWSRASSAGLYVFSFKFVR